MGSEDDDRRIAALEADNRRLRRLLDQQDAPAELRHRLRSTLALLRMIIRKSAGTPRDMEDYVAHLEDRLDAVMRALATADAHGNVALRALIEDELEHYGARVGEKVRLSGPPVHFKPRAGQVFALAIHELAVNSVEHGVLGGDGRVDIAWSVQMDETDTTLTFTWAEEGNCVPVDPQGAGFGTEVLTHALRYELKASTDVAYAPKGLKWTVRLPLTERIGQVGAPGYV